MVLSIDRQAVVSAGVDATICQTGTYTLSTTTQIHGASILWTSSTTGTFSPNAQTLHAVYNPSAADITNGSVTLTLTAQSASQCIPATDYMILTVNHQEIVNAGENDVICETGTYKL